MRLKTYLAGVFLLGVGLVVAHHRFAPTHHPSVEPITTQHTPEFFAERDTECGLELLSLAHSESGPFERVVPTGPNQPNERLRRNVWELGRYKLKGRFTGKQRGRSGCATYPEFEVSDFQPWGDVQRCSSPGALTPEMQLWTGTLPTERYVPEDFIDGPWPPSIDDGTCRFIGACAIDQRVSIPRERQEEVIDKEDLPSMDGGNCPPTEMCSEGEHLVQACSGDVWCCRLLPEDAAGQ
jgi:hypothetical protein